MKILIMALSLLVTPFFLHADIFKDGTVDIEGPQIKPMCEITKEPSGSGLDQYVGSSCDIEAISVCEAFYATDPIYQGQVSKRDYRNKSGYFIDTTTSKELHCTYESWSRVEINWVPTWVLNGPVDYKVGGFSIDEVNFATCPPDTFPSYEAEITDEEGIVIGCFDPNQASLVDECNINSTDEYLAIPVTSSSVCYTTPNGSQCKYDSVDVGNGVEAYALDLEGDCYSDNELPDIDGLPTDADTPSNENDTCKDWGVTGMVCPENKNDVCDDYGVCDEGCGTVNGVFVCIDNDFDGDGIPDYLDPDIDGDGIRNEDDLDSDGDGIDDSIDISNPDNSNDLDLSPVVGELKKANAELNGIGKTADLINGNIKDMAKDVKDMKESITTVDIPLRDKPLDNLKSFWESDYPLGIEGVVNEKMAEVQGTEFFSFLEQFQISVGGSSATYDMCFNLGSMGNFGCHNFNIDPRTFPAIKIFILISAVFLCRRILFGG